MGSGIDAPIVVIEGGDFQFFDAVGDALSSIEPWYPSWVPDYRAYDCRGRRLELVADPLIVEKRLLFGLLATDNAHESTLIIRPLEVDAPGQEELTDLLRGYLHDVAPDLATEQMALPELWAEASGRA